ncbi:MAG: glycosyltransferase, partial [Actinomycetota bacterium]
MNILVLHSNYTSGAASGENQVVSDEIRLLRDGGHSVQVLAPTPEVSKPSDMARIAAGALWGRHSAAQVREAITRHHVDIVHCHNLYPMLSPTVIRAAHEMDRPVVMTLHNHRMMCLNGTLLRDGHPCEDCVGKTPLSGVIHGCYRNSRPESALLATSITIHRRAGSFASVTRYLAVSGYIAKRHIEIGIPREQIAIKPNFAWPGKKRMGPGLYSLYLGRFSEEKGVLELVRSWKPRYGKLLVVGEGPLREDLNRISDPNIEVRDSVQPEVARDLISEARAVLVPSLCHEGSPRVVLEAFASGVPVIASRMGALPELIEEGRTGYLFDPRSQVERDAALARLTNDEELVAIGSHAYRRWHRYYSPAAGLSGL